MSVSLTLDVCDTCVHVPCSAALPRDTGVDVTRDTCVDVTSGDTCVDVTSCAALPDGMHQSTAAQDVTRTHVSPDGMHASRDICDTRTPVSSSLVLYDAMHLCM